MKVAFAALLASTLLAAAASPYPNCAGNPSGLGQPCLTCDPGYVSFYNSTVNLLFCFGCSPNCQICQNAGPTKCDTCSQGYRLNPNSQTGEPCAANCSKCDQTGRDMCDPGYCNQGYGPGITSLRMQPCSNCSSNGCLNCSNSWNNCAGCSPGFYFFRNAGGIGACGKCTQNCLTCSNWTSCDACLDGYIFDADANQCVTPTTIIETTNSKGIIIAVVLGILLTIVCTYLGYRKGRKMTLIT